MNYSRTRCVRGALHACTACVVSALCSPSLSESCTTDITYSRWAWSRLPVQFTQYLHLSAQFPRFVYTVSAPRGELWTCVHHKCNQCSTDNVQCTLLVHWQGRCAHDLYTAIAYTGVDGAHVTYPTFALTDTAWEAANSGVLCTWSATCHTIEVHGAVSFFNLYNCTLYPKDSV